MCDPISIEQHVCCHPDVRAILMVGTGRSQPALIVVRASDESDSQVTAQGLAKIFWPIIDEINQGYKIGSWVSKSHIIHTSLQQPMRRTGEGTLQCGPSLELYKDALDTLRAREGDTITRERVGLAECDPRCPLKGFPSMPVSDLINSLAMYQECR